MKSLRPYERLRSPAEFQRIFKSGARSDGSLFLMIAAAGRGGASRLGLAVQRRVAHAAGRNRAKRFLRESFRRNKPPAGTPLDIVLLPKRELLTATAAEVEREFCSRLQLVVSRLSRAAAAARRH